MCRPVDRDQGARSQSVVGAGEHRQPSLQPARQGGGGRGCPGQARSVRLSWCVASSVCAGVSGATASSPSETPTCVRAGGSGGRADGLQRLARHDAVPARTRPLVPTLRLGHGERERSGCRGRPPLTCLPLVVGLLGEHLHVPGGGSESAVDDAAAARVVAHDPRTLERLEHRAQTRQRGILRAGHDLGDAEVTDGHRSVLGPWGRVVVRLEQPDPDGVPGVGTEDEQRPRRALRLELAVDATPAPGRVGRLLRRPCVEKILDDPPVCQEDSLSRYGAPGSAAGVSPLMDAVCTSRASWLRAALSRVLRPLSTGRESAPGATMGSGHLAQQDRAGRDCSAIRHRPGLFAAKGGTVVGRYLFYSHDGYGLGHVRRNSLIARAVLKADPRPR